MRMSRRPGTIMPSPPSPTGALSLPGRGVLLGPCGTPDGVPRLQLDDLAAASRREDGRRLRFDPAYAMPNMVTVAVQKE